MTFTLIIVLNAILSALAVLGVGGCVLLARRLPNEPSPDANPRDWSVELPVAVVAEDAESLRDESARYPAAA